MHRLSLQIRGKLSTLLATNALREARRVLIPSLSFGAVTNSGNLLKDTLSPDACDRATDLLENFDLSEIIWRSVSPYIPAACPTGPF